MRILNRPMFRYGGPIKEGLMHGMKNGGLSKQFNTGLVGDERYPKTGGREHHLAFLPPLYAAGAAALRFLPAAYRGWKGAKWLTPGKLGKWGRFKDMISPSTRFKNVTTPKGHPGSSFKYEPAPLSWKEVLKSPEKWGAAIGENPFTTFGVASMAPQAGYGAYRGIKAGVKALPDAAKRYADMVIPGDQSRWWKKKEPVDPGTMRGAGPLHGAKDIPPKKPKPISAEELAAKAKAARTAKMEKYLDTMGYDKSKDTALSNALIDASAIVQEGTDEAGSLKDADWSKLINRAIQSTSKRLDKPEQIREAVGLMMTKADIEKDLEDPQVKKLRALEIKKGEKALAGLTTAEIIQSRMLKDKYPTGKELARLVSINNPTLDLTVIPSTGMDVDVDTIDYITAVVKRSHDEGKPFPPGNYVIKDRIIQVDETGKITPIPISSLK